MNQSHSNLTLLPALTPENVFEPIVNRHHAEVRFRDAQQDEAERIHRVRSRIGLALTIGTILSTALGILIGAGILTMF